MVYLDYSATTNVNKEVLESFNKINLEFVGNANSLHKLGTNINNLINSASKQIADILNVKSNEIIYTSGASEANNLAIKGVALKYSNRGKHIITTRLEHSSVNEPMNYLKSIGFEISYVETNEFGLVDLENLKSIIRDDTILVSINAVNSEIGIKQDIEMIGKLLKNYPKCFFHTDITQAVGKINVNLENVDLASFSGHKIYGLKGIGALIKKENVLLEPLIHGGKSTTIYRSGTPSHPLIASLSKALRLSVEDLDNKRNVVKEYNNYIKDNLKKYNKVYINSPDYSIPHILNISIEGVKSETFMHALEEYDVYVSTKTACSKEGDYSENVYDLTKDIKRAQSSIRISISHLTTKEEIDEFLNTFNKCYKKLIELNNTV